ncbi:MAG: DUF4843 domain-containing protein [Lacibacter sp.]
MKSFFSYTHIIATLAIGLSLAGCSKNDRLMYEEDPRIYFYTNAIVDYTFAVRPASYTVDTLYIPIRIMGSAQNRQRTFNLKVEDSSTAKLGYHLTFAPLVIPANAYQISLPVYLHRKPGLKDSVVTAHISIAESADFKLGYINGVTGTGTTGVLDRLHYRINITDQLTKPTNWDTYWVNHFGVFSKVKFQFLIQVTGKTSWNSSPLPQDLNFLVQTAKYALYNYEQANGPLMDENGVRVVFP